jgi:hypothetical protein
LDSCIVSCNAFSWIRHLVWKDLNLGTNIVFITELLRPPNRVSRANDSDYKVVILKTIWFLSQYRLHGNKALSVRDCFKVATLTEGTALLTEDSILLPDEDLVLQNRRSLCVRFSPADSNVKILNNSCHWLGFQRNCSYDVRNRITVFTPAILVLSAVLELVSLSSNKVVVGHCDSVL